MKGWKLLCWTWCLDVEGFGIIFFEIIFYIFLGGMEMDSSLLFG